MTPSTKENVSSTKQTCVVYSTDDVSPLGLGKGYLIPTDKTIQPKHTHPTIPVCVQPLNIATTWQTMLSQRLLEQATRMPPPEAPSLLRGGPMITLLVWWPQRVPDLAGMAAEQVGRLQSGELVCE